jgi:hypothetical protein
MLNIFLVYYLQVQKMPLKRRGVQRGVPLEMPPSKDKNTTENVTIPPAASNPWLMVSLRLLSARQLGAAFEVEYHVIQTAALSY